MERITIEAASVYSSVQNHLTKFDISKLKKVASLSIDFNPLEEIMLGDNPVTELAFENLCWFFVKFGGKFFSAHLANSVSAYIFL